MSTRRRCATAYVTGSTYVTTGSMWKYKHSLDKEEAVSSAAPTITTRPLSPNTISVYLLRFRLLHTHVRHVLLMLMDE